MPKFYRPSNSSRAELAAMPSAANLANKELRFALLSLFPSADLKLVSEAACCGDLDVASDFLRTALAERAAASAAAAPPVPVPSPPAPSEPGPSPEGLPAGRVPTEGTRDVEAKLAGLIGAASEDHQVSQEAIEAAKLEAAMTL